MRLKSCARLQPFAFPWPGMMVSAEYPDRFPEAYNTFLGMTMDAITLEEGQEVAFELPVTAPGDAERGAELFAITYGCSACHGNPETGDPAASIGPDLSDIAVTGDDRIDGYNASQYVYDSILNPAAYIAPECPNGECANAMSTNFGDRMSESPQDMIDMMTYLLGSDLDTAAISE